MSCIISKKRYLILDIEIYYLNKRKNYQILSQLLCNL